MSKPDMVDNRSAFRYKTSRPAKIMLDDGNRIECIVRDISTKGARLELTAPTKTPDQFVLFIRGQNQRFHCNVVWRNENVMGVRYF